MGIIKRQSLKTSIVNYVGVLIGVVFFVFVFPHIISEEYLGLIGLLQNLTFILVSLPMLGLAHVLLRFFAVWKNGETASQFNAFSLLVMGVSLAVFAITYYLLKAPIIALYKTHSALFLPYYLVIIPLVVIQAYSQYFEIYAMVKLRVAVPAFLREIVTRLLLIFLIFLFAYQFLNEKQFILGFLLVYLLTFLVLILYSVKGLQFKAFGYKEYMKGAGFRSQMAYGGGMLLLTIFNNVSNFLDSIILPAYLGLGALGIYLRPLVLGQMIQVPYRAISLISIPIIREAIVENNMQKVKELNNDIAINLFLIGCFLFSLLIGNTDAIFSLFPAKYVIAKDVLYIIAVGRLLDMAFGLNSEILNYSKYYKFIILFAGIMMFLTIGLNVMLIPRFGMNGAALSVSISLIIFNLLKTWMIYKKFHFHCFSFHYLTLILISAFVIGILYFIPTIQFVQHHMFFNSLLNIGFRSLIGLLLFLIPTYYVKVSPDLNDFIQLILSGKLFRGGHKMEEL
ncbi:MAG: polysaccharide biosynthesis C-terminal domain-containing protein [Bacteroidetes bacterium]|nr:polysaccharide biosynthesis C-terminal domain-containing protein [Bacteroidota bacterium]